MNNAKIQHPSSIKQGSVQVPQKVNSFYDRMCEPGPVSYGLTASVGVAAYMFSNPILAAISIGAGTILLFKRVATFFAQDPIALKDPITVNIEKMKSVDVAERLSVLKFISEAYDKTSAQNQVAIIKAMTNMLNDDFNDNAMIVLGQDNIRALIDNYKIDTADKYEAFVDGFVAFFEMIASNDAKKTKLTVLLEAILQLKRFLVEKKAPDTAINMQADYLIKLHRSLDNLKSCQTFTSTITEMERRIAMERIDKIKQELPLSTANQVALNLDNIRSHSPYTRRDALVGLLTAYNTAEDQVAILKAIIIMLNDNSTDTYNGYRAIRELQLFVQNDKINDATKLQTIVDGFANYLSGETNYTSSFSENKRVLNFMIETLLPEFISKYTTDIKKHNISLALLKESLRVLHKNIPEESFKSQIIRIHNKLD